MKKHPFNVGGTYRNRRGEYEVISIDGPKMVILYSHGGMLETTVKLQARIWRNIQTEESEQPPAQRPRSRRRRGRRATEEELAFEALQDNDFQKGVAGTSWRARTGFGGALAQQMSDATGQVFQSYVSRGRAEVHIARPACYQSKTKRQHARFVFQLDAEGATYGFTIEKNDGPMDDTWHWPTFLAALSGQPRLRQGVESAMRELELHWEVYVGAGGDLTARVQPSPTGLTWEWEDTGVSEEILWPAFTQRLQDIDTKEWCDLYLWTSMAKSDAIAAGTGLVDTVTQVYRALLPLYEASTQPTGSGTDA
jgi:hypothetical protein